VNLQHRTPKSPAEIAARLNVHERVLLFCLASGTDWQRAGVHIAAAARLVVSDLVEREQSPARFKLTPLGAEAFAALVRVPLAYHDGNAA
jgi:hypothetical protein